MTEKENYNKSVDQDKKESTRKIEYEEYRRESALKRTQHVDLTEEDVLVSPSEYFKSGFMKMFDEIVHETKSTKKTLLSKAMILYILAHKAKMEGYHIAIVNDAGQVITRISGIDNEDK